MAYKKSLTLKLGFLLSGWQDSNLRPPRPKRGAITGLRYTPMIIICNKKIAERQGFEPWVPISRYDDLANRSFRPLRHLSVTIMNFTLYLKCGCKCNFSLLRTQQFFSFFIRKIILGIQFLDEIY